MTGTWWPESLYYRYMSEPALDYTVVSPVPFVCLAYEEPLEWEEVDGELHLMAPSSGRVTPVEPLRDRGLASRFAALERSPEALLAFFQPIGHPAGTRQAMPLKKMARLRLRFHVPWSKLRDFHRDLKVWITCVSALANDRRAAGDFVHRPTRARTWTFEYRDANTHVNRAITPDDPSCGWLAQQPYDERRFLALHVFLHRILKGVMQDRFDLVPVVSYTGPYEVSHPVHYRPRDLLGAILFQSIIGQRGSMRWRRCRICNAPMLGNRKRETCSDRCRQERWRRGRAASPAAT